MKLVYNSGVGHFSVVITVWGSCIIASKAYKIGNR